jgi:hypothetical protein
MGTTVTIDDDLVLRAREITGRTELFALVRLGMERLIASDGLMSTFSRAPCSPRKCSCGHRISTRDGRSRVGCRLEPRMTHTEPAPGHG